MALDHVIPAATAPLIDAARPTCPACLSARTVVLPPSHATQLRLLRCRDCGLRAIADRSQLRAPEAKQVVEGEEYDYAAYVSVMRESATFDDRRQVLARLASMTHGRPDRSLFDVGGGDGTFCALAREHGFAVTGNEIAPEAVELARDRNDVELHLGLLDELGLEEAHDVATMWCVLAHVDDVDGFVEDTFRLLKPGGVLYLQTPHFNVIDRIGTGLVARTGGRASRLADIRISDKHWKLHTARSIEALLARHGFTDVDALPRARFSLSTEFYLSSLGVPGPVVRSGGKALDRAIERGWAPRLVLDVFARKPH